MRSLRVEPVTLSGKYVRLEPLDIRHASDLARHAEPSLFKYFAAVLPKGQSRGDMEQYIAERNTLSATISFAVVIAETGEAVGTTSYLEIRPSQLGLEVGMTWYGKEHQGTALNPETKLLLLTHAFEDLGCERVQLKTDVRNLQSRRGIEKLGAVKEGVLRSHRYLADGVISDTVMYSIIAAEWPSTKDRLIIRLSQLLG